MNINFIFRKNISGRPSIHRNFEPMISKLIQEGHSVTETFLPYDGGQPWNILKNIIFLKKHRIKNGINHVTGDVHYAILALIGVPSVLTIHDDYQVRGFSKHSLHYFYRWLFWIYFPIKFAREVVCITPSTKKSIENYYDKKKLNVITHHDMTSDFPYSPKVFNTQCPTIFHMGTAKNKNLETTLKAVSKIKCKLCVLKPMTELQKQTANSLHLDYENKYDLTNQEVYEEYKKADIILFPSLYEGLGMPVLEGQSIGRPVITTNRDPMKWIAGKEGALLLNDPLDEEEMVKAIRQIVDNEELRDSLVRNGRNNIKRFALDNAIKAYIDIYNKAIKNENINI